MVLYIKAEHDKPVSLPYTLSRGAYRIFACHGGENALTGSFQNRSLSLQETYNRPEWNTGLHYIPIHEDQWTSSAYVEVGDIVRFSWTSGAGDVYYPDNVHLNEQADLRVEEVLEEERESGGESIDWRLVRFSYFGNDVFFNFGTTSQLTITVVHPSNVARNILMSVEDQQGSIFSPTDVVSSYNGVAFPGKILVPYNEGGSIERPLYHMLFRVDRDVKQIRVRFANPDGSQPEHGQGSVYLGIEVPQIVL